MSGVVVRKETVNFRSKDMKKVQSLSAACLLCFSGFCGAQQSSPIAPVPSHCKPDEHVFLTARLGKFKDEPTGTKWIPNGKIVSLCTDKSQEPFNRVAYRFGPIGAVELEEVASSARKFSSFFAPAHKVGHQGVFFDRGDYRYYVMEATGMGHGVSLLVYKAGKLVVDLYSSTEEENYFSGTGPMDFESPKSPALTPRPAPQAKDFG